ncbi:MAG: MerR family transcriptional regulator [Anaerolineae bacterium]|nr:MerR family transcriptional regulator [Anaerolineae bacterium]
MAENEAIYNIGVVSRMTDIPSATLRVWERRYGFPVCDRTEGGHRLYTMREIERLRWVKEKVDSGMQARQAVRALETLSDAPPEKGKVVSSLMQNVEPFATSTPGEDSYLHTLQHRMQDALHQHSIDDADKIFDEAMALYTPEDIMLYAISPTLRNIGIGWEKGNVTIATEHLASHYLRQRLTVWIKTGPPAFDVPTTVLAGAPGEYHEGGLLMFGAMLRRRRWPVAYLGQSIPLVEVASFVKQTPTAAIVMVAMTEEPAVALAQWPELLPEIAAAQRPAFGYAGRIFNLQPEWRSRVQGVFLGATLGEGVQTLERLLQSYYFPST